MQFHPEATVEIVAEWARADAAQLAALGIDDAAALLAASPEHVEAAAAAAFRLFDAFLASGRPIAAEGCHLGAQAGGDHGRLGHDRGRWVRLGPGTLPDVRNT